MVACFADCDSRSQANTNDTSATDFLMQRLRCVNSFIRSRLPPLSQAHQPQSDGRFRGGGPRGQAAGAAHDSGALPADLRGMYVYACMCVTSMFDLKPYIHQHTHTRPPSATSWRTSRCTRTNSPRWPTTWRRSSRSASRTEAWRPCRTTPATATLSREASTAWRRWDLLFVHCCYVCDSTDSRVIR